jgi:hypothetical protein
MHVKAGIRGAEQHRAGKGDRVAEHLPNAVTLGYRLVPMH